LGKYARSLAGVDSGDSQQFMFKYWEIPELLNGWIFQLNSVNATIEYGGRGNILLFENGQGALSKCPGGSIRNVKFWGKPGVTVSTMGNNFASLSLGESWCRNCACLVPEKVEHLLALWVYCSSEEFYIAVRKMNQKLRVAEALFELVPFDLDHWTKIAAEKYPNGLPKPYSDDPTQWIFHGHPAQSDDPLQVAVARLLGYRWPAELQSTKSTKDTKTDFELSDEALHWLKRTEELLPFTDDDGIVCIPPVRGEMRAEDRLLNLLAKAHSQNDSLSCFSCISWTESLLKQADHAGKFMETWLRDKFFAQHCKLFQHRPFIWHIWDGLRDGFAALVNYHKLDYKTLETLIYTYLGDWISRQKQDIANGVDGAAEKLAAAEQLRKKLELILEGEAPYDIFVRWKPLDKQPIGWNPDINDGVRINIRPFMTAGVLRFNKKPQINISWDKDRGKDVESAPWYHLFNGDRINDHHLSLAEKKAVQ
jgi:hypothetical protein